MNLVLERAKAPTAEIVALLAELNAALDVGYAPEQKHALSLDQLFQPNIRFLVARVDGAAVACGGIGFYDGYAELKRMYAKPEVRGKGVAKALLQRLEAEARGAGMRVIQIETGNLQMEAMRFYEREGYRRCDAFAPYAAMLSNAIATSMFYEKQV
ncbi:GNAT family N-acetyltransferase [Dongia sp.]|uniref:GNAT family N-acetyltransferase n=1 Tax=Dongia sp. TaxID=1977262 RepID=UPI003753AD75